MALTLNTRSNFGDKPVSIEIEGKTPDALTLCGLTIQYETKEINETLTDWKGSISFIGRPDDYKAFGTVTQTSHPVKITYDDKLWIGYIDAQVYDVPNTGFDEVFTLNIVSSLITLSKPFDKPIYLYSIGQILEEIWMNTKLQIILPSLSFSEDLYNIKVNSNNFLNDDGEYETLLTLLEWICTSFGLKAIVNDYNLLCLTSYEKLYNSNNTWSDANHLGIDETYSVGKFYDSGRVIANNYEIDNIDVDFNIIGDEYCVWGISGIEDGKTFWNSESLMLNPYSGLPNSSTNHPYSMNYNRGKSGLIGDGNWVTYDRNLLQYGKTKQLKFNKYSATGITVDEYSASETNNTPSLIAYMNNNGELLPGAYPISYNEYGKDTTNLPEPERTTIFKLNYYNTDQILDQVSARNMIYFKREGIQFSENKFLFFNFEFANGVYYGQAENGELTWPTTTKKNARGFGNMDKCPVSLVNDYAPDTRATGNICLTAKITTVTGTQLWWSWDTSGLPRWDTVARSANCYTDLTDMKSYEFLPVRSMRRPRRGDVDVPLTKEPKGYWLELPTVYCTLEISIGVAYPSPTTAPMSIIMRNFNLEQIGTKELFEHKVGTVERKDTVYSTDEVTENAFPDVTFNLCSSNEHNGLAALYYFNDIDVLDKLTYSIGSEKIEEHYIRLIVKLFSKYEKFNDIIYLDDLKFNYSDRWFNGGTLDLIEGTVNGCFISHNNNISGEIK
jgi:hypothetical protein